MGALSPAPATRRWRCTRTATSTISVATDAIGMGLNLDIEHVAFAGLVKFDGRRHRHLPRTVAQIAGRAGRYYLDGTFGVTGEAAPLEPEWSRPSRATASARWRACSGGLVLDFGATPGGSSSLEAPPGPPRPAARPRGRRPRDAEGARGDAGRPRPAARAGRHPAALGGLPGARLPQGDAGRARRPLRAAVPLPAWRRHPDQWLARQIARIDRTDGDIDALSKRLAYIRTWTYVAQRGAWVDDADHWREETRAVEDRLSDALHVQLTQRFVDRRTSVMRQPEAEEVLCARPTKKRRGLDRRPVHRPSRGFRFRLDPTADADQARTLRAAGLAALAPALSLLSDKFYNAPDTEIDVTEQGGLMWGEHAVGKLVAGADALAPQVQPFVDEDADPGVAEKVRRRLGHWIDRRIAQHFAPLIALRDDETLTGMARGIAFRLIEALGILPRGEIAEEVKGLDQESRASLRKHGVRFGQHTVFLPLLLKPAPTRLRLVLWSLQQGFDVFPEAPPPGLVTVAAVPDAPAAITRAPATGSPASARSASTCSSGSPTWCRGLTPAAASRRPPRCCRSPASRSNSSPG